MKKSLKISIFALLVILLFAFGIYALSYIPFFSVSSIKVSGFESVPKEISEILKPYYGLNRFRINEKKLKETLEATVIVESAEISYSFPAKMSVSLSEIKESFFISDGESLFLFKDGKPGKVDGELVSFLSYEPAVIEISSSYLSYLERYGADENLQRLVSLLEEVTKTQGNLISRIKYDNNNSNDFGELMLTLGPLNSELYVRSRVSSKRISDAIQVIKNEAQNDKAQLLGGKTIRYDLYQNAIVKSS